MGFVVDIERAQTLRGIHRKWAYNALDCTGPLEIAETLLPRLDERERRTYAFERACQNPALTMMRRGVRVNTAARTTAITEAQRELKAAALLVDKLPEVQSVWDGTELETGKCPKNDGKPHRWPRGEPDETRRCTLCNRKRMKRSPFNANSPPQTVHLFHDLHGIPRMKNKKGEYAVDEFVLDRIGRKYPLMKPITDAILHVRGLKKQLGFLKAKLTPDNRFMSSFNVGAAWTGRWSSSKNPFGLGSNLQNIAEQHRNIFVADAGYKLCYADLAQAESRTVAYVSEDQAYIDAHLTGDVHTAVCRLVWPELEWTGDIKADKVIAGQNPEWDQAPGHGYRFQAKRIQHGLNYGLSPTGISNWAHIPRSAAEDVYERYFTQFPFIKVWQEKMAVAVRNEEVLETPLGRTALLFGRPWDPHTHKQALAFIPQSTVGDIINLALWKVWKDYDPHLIQILGQVHDAIFCQFRLADEALATSTLRDIMTIDVEINGRTMTIPVDIATGMNWGKHNADPAAGRLNPNGMKEIK